MESSVSTIHSSHTEKVRLCQQLDRVQSLLANREQQLQQSVSLEQYQHTLREKADIEQTLNEVCRLSCSGPHPILSLCPPSGGDGVN